MGGVGVSFRSGDKKATVPNLPPQLLGFLAQKYGNKVTAEDFIAYVAATAAHPAFTSRFRDDLTTPGLRIPITADGGTFREAAELGRAVIWLHTFGERMPDPEKGRTAQPPRLPAARMPRIPAEGEISQDPSAMPDTIAYDAKKKRLLIGQGYVEHVEPVCGIMRFPANKCLCNGSAIARQIGNGRLSATAGLHPL
jgi:hypothetical protein